MRAHKLSHPAGLEMPQGFDSSGIPSSDRRHTRPRSASTRRHRSLPGLAPTSVIASVEEVAAEGEGQWLMWGCVADRPVLFAVEPTAAAEMAASLASGHAATAIVEPWQLLLERLD